MIDTTTHKPLRVSVVEGAPPSIMLTVQQLGHVCTLLDANAIPYWVDEDAISIDGEPEVTVITLGQNTNAADVQAILDAAP